MTTTEVLSMKEKKKRKKKIKPGMFLTAKFLRENNRTPGYEAEIFASQFPNGATWSEVVFDTLVENGFEPDCLFFSNIDSFSLNQYNQEWDVLSHMFDTLANLPVWNGVYDKEEAMREINRLQNKAMFATMKSYLFPGSFSATPDLPSAYEILMKMNEKPGLSVVSG